MGGKRSLPRSAERANVGRGGKTPQQVARYSNLSVLKLKRENNPTSDYKVLKKKSDLKFLILVKNVAFE